jgi:formamidopyrimidine-DNA glycosylase
MPELPEVEVLKRHLASLLPGRVIRQVQVFQTKVIRPHGSREFDRLLRGARFEQVERRGKYLLFSLRSPAGNPVLLVGHLGMTGRMYLVSSQARLPDHAVVCLRLDRGRLVYEDPRRFGRLSLDSTSLARLGPEPLESQFTARVLQQKLAGSRQPIKVRLMDQQVVAGVGNIYASEALWRAGISPRKAAGRLSAREYQRLWRALRAVLREAISWGSTIPLDFAGRERGEKLFYYGVQRAASGYYHERLRVYDRHGQPCQRCGAHIRRMEQGGRSTFYCPVCQQ